MRNVGIVKEPYEPIAVIKQLMQMSLCYLFEDARVKEKMVLGRARLQPAATIPKNTGL